MEWFYSLANERVGPVTLDDLRNLVAQGILQPESLVWKDGMADWRPISTIRELTMEPLAPPPAQTASPTLVTCTVSGKQVPQEEAIEIGGHYVSAENKAIYLQQLREGASGKVTIRRYAGFWIRSLAYTIDAVIISVVSFLIVLAPILILSVNMPPEVLVLFMVFMNFAFLLFHFGYCVFFVAKFSATPGKMALRLKVVRPDGGSIGFGVAVKRYFAQMVSGITWMAGFIMAGVDEEKRALHDRMCDTRVIHL